MSKPTPAHRDKRWSSHSRDWLRSDGVPLTTSEIEAGGELCDECGNCGAIREPAAEDRCAECKDENCMATGRRFNFGLQTYFVSYT